MCVCLMALAGACAAQPGGPVPTSAPGTAPTTPPASPAGEVTTTPPAAPAPAKAPELPTVGEVIDRVYQAYRAGVRVERVTLSIISPSTRTATAKSTVVVRTAPADGGVPPRALLDLDNLRLHIDGRRVTAWSVDNPGLFWRTEVEGEPTPAALAAAIGPLPFPQLHVVFGQKAQWLASVVPGVSDIRWIKSRVLADAPGVLLLDGEGGPGAYELQTDARTGLLLGVSGPMNKEGFALLARIEPVVEDTRSPEAWALDTTGRKQVARMKDLAEKPPAPITPAGTNPAPPTTTTAPAPAPAPSPATTPVPDKQP